MKYICTSKGFIQYAGCDVDESKIQKKDVRIIIYTDKIRYAKQFNLPNSKIDKFMKANSIEGFIYNPCEEEPVRGSWKCISYRDIFNNLYWIATPAYMVSKTDIKFLYEEKFESESEILTELEAKMLANKKNKEMIDGLNSKLYSL